MRTFLKLQLSESIFIAVGLLLQVVTFVVAGEDWVSLVCGLAGVCSVVLCSQRKIAYYLFGFIQVSIYFFLSLQQRLYGQCWVNLFYFLTMLIGVVAWLSHYNADEDSVEARSLSMIGWLIVLFIFAVGLVGGYMGLKATNDSQPFKDALSTVPSFIAQILMILRFKEQWLFWLVVDVITLFIWINVDWIMVTLYAFWVVTCVYGYVKWSK